MSVAHNLVSVTTTATNILAGVTDARGGSRSVSVQNVSSVTVYLGGQGVTSTNYGFALAAGSSVSYDLDKGERLYAVVATGTASVATLHTGV